MAGVKQDKIERGGGRPADGYRIDGKRVPGTTTITGRFKDSGGLIRWAYKRGKEGLELYGSRDKAGELGSIVHDAIEEDIHGNDGRAYLDNYNWDNGQERLPETGEHPDKEQCIEAFEAYREWRGGAKIELEATEVSMLSQDHKFGGTLDAVATINGKHCILDWKTSSGVYPDYIIQLGAYAILWHETRGKVFEGAHLLRVSKVSGAFHHHYFPQRILRLGAEQFLNLRKAYELDYQLKRAMK